MDLDIREIQKDISEYLRDKYGSKVQLVGFNVAPKAEQADDDSHTEEANESHRTIHFAMKPEELKAYLDEYLVKQDEAKRVLATKVCTHFNRIKRFELNRDPRLHESIGEIKNNIMMIGPTGVGKTYLVKLIARKLGVPFVKGDATKFSETGYVGGDVEDLIRDLVQEAGGDISIAQYGIVYLDEIDKIAASPNLIGPDVSRSGVQRALLKPMEETEVDLRAAHDPIAQMEALTQFQKTGKRERKRISTKNILFIMSGAFNGLEEIVKKRINEQGMGFGADIRSKDERVQQLRHVKAEDLVEYGFESEFIGRLPVVTVFENLEVEDLYKILRSPKSPVIQSKKRDFKAYGIDLQFEDASLRALAEKASRERTGARGLVSVIERVLLRFEHALPSTDIRHLVVTRAVVENPEVELGEILAAPEDPERERLFGGLMAEEANAIAESMRRNRADLQTRHGVHLSDSRVEIITRRAVEERMDLDSVVQEVVAVSRAAGEFGQIFSEKNEVRVSLSEEALDCLIEIVWEKSVDPKTFLSEAFRDYAQGLKLVKERAEKDEIVLPAEALRQPQKYLSRLIQEAYRK